MAKFLLCVVAFLAVASSAAALRTVVHRPVPVILAELRAEAAQSGSDESSSFQSESGQAAAELSQFGSSQSGESTISATDVLGGSSSSMSSMMSSIGASSMGMPAPVPGPDPMSQGSSSSPAAGSYSSSASSSSSSSASSAMGSDFSSSPTGRVQTPKKPVHRKKRLPETDVFGEAPHTDLTPDEVDLVARDVLKDARRARCAKEDEYCELQFKNCKDEACRRQVEDQSSLNPHEKKEIARLLKN